MLNYGEMQFACMNTFMSRIELDCMRIDKELAVNAK